MNTLQRAARTILLASATIVPLALVATSAQAALVISSGVTKNVTCSGGICTATAKSAVLNAGDLQTMLASASVTVATGTINQSIHVEAALTWVSFSTLTLSSQQQITIDQPISVAGTGGFSLAASEREASGAYLLSLGATITFWSTSDQFTINGNHYSLENSIATLASDIVKHGGGGLYALANSYDASSDGTYSHPPIAGNFQGDFDGLGNTISNLSISDSDPDNDNVGLFANVTQGAELRNLILSSVSISSGAHEITSALAGQNEGTILRSSVTNGTVSDPGNFVGGLVA